MNNTMYNFNKFELYVDKGSSFVRIRNRTVK